MKIRKYNNDQSAVELHLQGPTSGLDKGCLNWKDGIITEQDGKYILSNPAADISLVIDLEQYPKQYHEDSSNHSEVTAFQALDEMFFQKSELELYPESDGPAIVDETDTTAKFIISDAVLRMGLLRMTVQPLSKYQALNNFQP